MKGLKKSLIVFMFISIASLLVFAVCSSNENQNSENGDEIINITFSWWTNPERTEMTKEAIELFEEKNPDIKVTTQYSGWDDYWEKLATNAVGGGLPDVMQMDGSRIQQYVNKDQLMDLTETDIDISDISEATIDAGKIDDKIYALTTSTNAQMFIYNPEILEEAGVEFPDENYSWEDFADLGEEIYDKTGVHLIANEAEQTAVLDYFLRTKGESLYSSDGKSVGATKEALEDWFQYWLDMQKTGAVPSADKSQSYDHNDHPSNPLVKEEAAFAWLLLGTEPEFEQDLGKPVERAFLPEWGNEDKPYDLHGAMYWTMSSNTEHPEASAKLIDFLENDPEVAEIFGVERGIPANHDNMDLVAEKAEDHHVEEQVEFMEKVEDISSPTLMEPESADEISELLKNVAEKAQAENI